MQILLPGLSNNACLTMMNDTSWDHALNVTSLRWFITDITLRVHCKQRGCGVHNIEQEYDYLKYFNKHYLGPAAFFVMNLKNCYENSFYPFIH